MKRPVVVIVRAATRLALMVLAAGAPAQTSNAVRLNPGGGGSGTPTLISDGDVLHAFWFDTTTYQALFYNRSMDNGRSWLPVERLLWNGQGATFAADQDVLFLCLRNPGGPTVIHSTDGGITWSPPSLISAQATTILPLLSAGQGALTAVWNDARNGSDDIWFNRSLDRGQTWQATDTQLDAGLPVAASFWRNVVRDGTAIHVSWVEGAGRAVAYARSLDLGITWSPPQILSFGPEGAVLSASGLNVFAAATGVGWGGSIQYSGLLHSVDAGSTWAPVTALASPILGVKAVGNLVLVVHDVLEHCARSLDGGLTWSTTQLPNVAGAVTGFPAQIAVTGNVVTVSQDFWPYCCFLHSCKVRQSHDLALTWGPTRFVSVGARCLETPGGHVLGIDGPIFQIVTGYQPYGIGKAGTGAVVPTLAWVGLPALGSTIVMTLQQARGGSLAAIGATLAGPANVPFGSGAIFVAPPVVPFYAFTSGAAGAPGAGTASASLAIPLSTAFVGQRVNFQGFVLDPGAADGFASTAGLEMWM